MWFICQTDRWPAFLVLLGFFPFLALKVCFLGSFSVPGKSRQNHLHECIILTQRLFGQDREAWWATVHGVAKSWTWLGAWTRTLTNRLGEQEAVQGGKWIFSWCSKPLSTLVGLKSSGTVLLIKPMRKVGS